MKDVIEIAVQNETGSIWDKAAEYFNGKPIHVLEIGVFRASQIEKAYSCCNIKSYIGVDPYLGDISDPYKGAYWRNEVDAYRVYEQSKKKFENIEGAELLKTTSEIFFRSIDKDRKFDVIFVDGNHYFRYALQDMICGFYYLNVGGVMIVDDYGNVDTPEVTRAVNCFLEMNYEYISSVDERVHWFKNRGKHIPICDKDIYIFKKSELFKPNLPRDYEKKYLWGTGKAAREYLEIWNGQVVFDGVLDNGILDDRSWNGLKQYNINEVSKDNSLIVVATYIYYDEIKEQLCSLGYEEGVNFINAAVYEAFMLNSWLDKE